MAIDRAVLVGPGDDAGVYLLDQNTALVETVDIITPLVNDPFTFGAISATNSLSDVYAMGGRPLTALALIGFSPCDYEPGVIKEIMKGALSVMKTAGASLMGGHSFEDSELKFGLSVTGTVDKDRILRAAGAGAGDIIILTKPVGTGIITTALKAGKINNSELEPVVKSMLFLNAQASEAALYAGATAATDVTGFGLLGHAFNMVKNSSIDFVIDSRSVPVFDKVREFISSGIIPEGAYKNLSFLDGKVSFADTVSEDEKLLFSDPQTSGGLLLTLPELNLERFVSRGIPHWAIGRVEKGEGRVRLF